MKLFAFTFLATLSFFASARVQFKVGDWVKYKTTHSDIRKSFYKLKTYYTKQEVVAIDNQSHSFTVKELVFDDNNNVLHQDSYNQSLEFFNMIEDCFGGYFAGEQTDPEYYTSLNTKLGSFNVYIDNHSYGKIKKINYVTYQIPFLILKSEYTYPDGNTKIIEAIDFKSNN